MKQTLVGRDILNQGNALTDPLGLASRGFYMGAIDGRTRYGDVIGAGPVSEFNATPQVPAADPDRRGTFAVGSGWVNFSIPPRSRTGTGSTGPAQRRDLPATRSIPGRISRSGSSCSMTPCGIPMQMSAVFADASLDQARYDWLVNELEKGQAEGKLMIIAAHLPIRNESAATSTTLDTRVPGIRADADCKTPYLPEPPPVDLGPCPPEYRDGIPIPGPRPPGTRVLGSRDRVPAGFPPAVPHLRDRPQQRQYGLGLRNGR